MRSFWILIIIVLVITTSGCGVKEEPRYLIWSTQLPVAVDEAKRSDMEWGRDGCLSYTRIDGKQFKKCGAFEIEKKE